MASKIDICNQALARIRSQPINSLTESSLQAQYCVLFYKSSLEFMLRDSPWSFAKKQIALAPVSDELFSWVYTYQYPSDCLNISRLMSAANKLSTSSSGNAIRPDYYDDNPLNDYASRTLQIPFEVLNSSNNLVIGANEPDLWIEYNIYVDDPNKFDSQFINAFTWYLASEIAVPIIGGDTGRAARNDALKMYQLTLNSANSSNSNERYNGSARESDFILSRG